MKKFVCKEFPGMLILITVFSISIQAQTDKTDLKKQNLENKIKMAEAKVTAAEERLAIADSLITYGEKRVFEAEDRFTLVEEEQRELEKEYNAEFKRLKKLTRSSDEAEAESAEDSLKVLARKYSEDSKAIQNEIRQLTRQAEKGDADMKKGKEKKRDALSRLKEANKSLELAQAKYEEFLNSPED